jgi:hypothetical protein
MAATGTVTITGALEGFGTGTFTVKTTVTATAARLETVNLTTGANTISVPSGMSSVLIRPPTTNTVVLTLKGISGDTGTAVHKTRPKVYDFDTGVTSFVINAASGVTGVELVWF